MAAIDFPSNPNSGDQFVVGTITWTYDGAKWTAYPGVLSVPDAPSDGQLYGRKLVASTMSWTPVGSGDTDAPIDNSLYGRKNRGWIHPTHLDITDWAATLAPYALTANVPGATSTLPKMDGTATTGSEVATFARGDHVHPSDTSRLAISGGTMTGPIVLAADPVAAMQPATKQYVDGGRLGDNRIINGNFAVNQRAYVSGTALAAAAYGIDRWKAGAGGCTYTFTAALPDTTITITAGTLTQIIEAGMIEGGVYTLSWTGSAQARVWQGTASGSYAASPLTTASLTAGTNTVVEFNTGTLTRVKLEVGSVATPFNRQSLAKSMADCQRYWQQVRVMFSADASNATGYYATSTLQVAPRAAPTLTAVNQGNSANFPATTGTLQYLFGTVRELRVATSTALGSSFQSSITADAEL